MRRKLVVTAAVLGAVLAPVPAWAFWTGGANVNAAAKAGALAAPTVSSALVSGDVRISVTAAPSTGPTPTSYRVDRIAPAGNAVTGVCTITAASGLGNCLDGTPVPGETNTYKVVGIVQSWNALDAVSPTTSTAVTGNRSFIVDAPASVVAGVPFTVHLTARRGTALDWLYIGSKDLDWSGMLAGPNGALASVPATAFFWLGEADVQVTLVRAGSTTLTVADGDNAARFGSDTLTVTAAPASKVAWTGVTAPAGTVSQTNATTYAVAGAGNNGIANGSLTLTDAYGNPITNAGTGWTLVLSAISDRPADVGAFKVGTTIGTNGQPLTVSFPSTGAATLSFTYTHNGTANYADVLTATAKTGTTATNPTLTVNLSK